jgi:gliding motility-associated-like protein
MQFEPVNGVADIRTDLQWLVGCENLAEGNQPKTYTLYLASQDDQCFNELNNVRQIDLIVSDVESTDEDFLPANVFTPNGDGVNDTYSLTNLPVDNCTGEFRSFRVHNRWGTEVYVSIEREFTWTGDGLLPGVYFYVVEFTNKEYSGTISILQ